MIGYQTETTLCLLRNSVRLQKEQGGVLFVTNATTAFRCFVNTYSKLAMSAQFALNLTQRPPRSLRCRLGGFAILPRMLDKCRALIAGTIGEYDFNCPLDQQFLQFTGIDADKLKEEIALGRTDSEMLAWVHLHMKRRLAPWEIESWSAYQERRMPTSDPDTATFYSKILSGISSERIDIHSWAELIDLDDHVSFGGTA